MTESTSGRFWKGAARGLGLWLLVFLLLTAYARVAPPTPSLGSFLAVSKLLLQMVLVGAAFLAGIRLLQRMGSSYLWVLACAIAAFYYHFGSFEPWGVFWALLFAIAPATVLGGCLALAATSRSMLARGGAVAGALVLAYVVWFFFRPGFEVVPPPNAAALSKADIPHLSLPDPARPGPYTVATLTYGSGRDRHREEFAEAADLVTEPVDGSPFIEGWEELSGWARTAYWGFDAESLPLQGRVWYPEGEGPFPLVLVVHGNHAMEDFSDPGYGYLGQLFASRGMILVSVDENFINSSFSGRLDELRGRGLKTENDARGWLLLKHLEQWRHWHRTRGNPFFGKVDLENLGLIGHSRGGEAVAVAASFNALSHYPDDANVKFDFGFSIRGIVAIAPVDGQYKPAGRGTPIRDTDYFVLHGSHDGDVQSFAGSRQFERVDVTGGDFHFKSSLYIYGANHGQFNTTWGRADSSFPRKNFLNLTHIMSEEEQRRIAEVYISAFFEISLRGGRGYLPLFQDARRGGDWLPETIYLLNYRDSTEQVLADFDEDIDVTTSTIAGGSLRGEHLTEWSEKLVELKHDDKGTSAVHLEWDRDEAAGIPIYEASLPQGLELAPTDSLVFSLADATEEDARSDPLDFTVALIGASGVETRLPLAHFSPLQPRIDVQVRKSALLNRTETWEPVFQTFSFPLGEFPEEISAGGGVVEIRFVFDRTEKGRILMDGLAIRR